MKYSIKHLFPKAIIFFLFLFLNNFSYLWSYEPYSEDQVAVYNISGPVNISSLKGYAVIAVELPEEFYTYANPKGPGTGMSIEVNSADGSPFTVSPRYPEGEKYFAPGEKDHVFIYKGLVRIPVMLQMDKAGSEPRQPVKLEVSMLICDDSICLPVKREVMLQIDSGFTLHGKAGFAALGEYAVLNDPPDQMPSADQSRLIKTGEASAGAFMALEELDFEPQYKGASMSGFLEAIIFGLIAGFILNFMPCVLPVVSLKIMSFVQNAGQEKKVIILQGLLFSSGIILSFFILATLAAYGGYSWGGLFQNQGFIVFMAAFIFALALSLFGVFSITPPAAAGVIAAKKRGIYSDAFVKGIVATLLATPCSGPFLGGTLAWTFNQPPSVIFMVFISIGIGMASPYIVMSFKPDLVKIIPKPGSWMIFFETFMGFLLILTVVYLLGILDDYHRTASILFFVFIGMGLWIFGRYGSFEKKGIQKITAFLLFLAISGSGYFISFKYLYLPADGAGAAYHGFSSELLLENRDNGIVSVVVFTADWCPNCKLVEKMTLEKSSVKRAFADERVNVMIADITSSGSEGEKLMFMLGSRAIPFLAVFPPGENFRNPLCLRDIYSADDVIEAVNSAKRGGT